MTPSYYAVIPASVRYCPDLCANAKLLYGELTALCDREGYAWPSNGYFSDLYDVRKETVSAWISELETAGFILVEVDRKAGNRRFIRLAMPPPLTENRNTPCDNPQDPSCEKPQGHLNTTSVNDTSNEGQLPVVSEKRFPHAKLFEEDFTINNLLSVHAFLETWRNYNKEMKAAKKGLTLSGARKLLGVLALQPTRVVHALTKCTENGWRSFEWEWLEPKSAPNIPRLDVKTPQKIYDTMEEQRRARKEPVL